MKITIKPINVQSVLNDIIKSMSDNPDVFVTNPGKDFSRTRKLSFETVIRMLIGMGGNSLQKELYDWFEYSDDTASVSAFIQQRSKISLNALEYIFKNLVQQCDEKTRFKGYRLLAVDGSDLRLPTNSSDFNSYIRNDDKTKGYNLLHLDAMYDLLQHIYVDASIQSKKGMNEHKAFVTMVDRSAENEKVIVIADRGYESFNNMAHLQEKSWNYIIRSKESYGIKFRNPSNKEFDINMKITLTRRQTKDTLTLIKENPERYRWIQPHTTFDYLAPRDNKMYDINFRIVRFQISESSYETVFTNLPADEFPPEVLKKLYQLRWGIETSFRELKYSVGLASVHSKKREFIYQEIFAKLILYNFSALIAYKVEPPTNKRINFSSALFFCRKFFQGTISDKMLLTMIKKFLSTIRPGRSFERFSSIKNTVGFTYRIC